MVSYLNSDLFAYPLFALAGIGMAVAVLVPVLAVKDHIRAKRSRRAIERRLDRHLPFGLVKGPNSRVYR